MSSLLSPLDNFIPNLLDCSLFPPSPSDTCSSIGAEASPSPPPDPIHVVCNVPLIAPRPLPYHSPTFLQFDLPDTDEDLSHPPYTHRPSKRKRDKDDNDPAISHPHSKRRLGTHRSRSRHHHCSWDLPSPPSHRSGNHRMRT